MKSWFRPLPSITLVFCLLSFSGKTIHGLRCYQCSWSSDPEEYYKNYEEAAPSQYQLADIKKPQHHRENPIAKPYIGVKIRQAPTAEEIMNLCEEKECLSSDNACLKWTYFLNTPINITYMCVGSKTQSGCYYQDVDTNAGSQHLKLEACLCDTPLCNGSTVVRCNHTNKILVVFITGLTILINISKP